MHHINIAIDPASIEAIHDNYHYCMLLGNCIVHGYSIYLDPSRCVIIRKDGITVTLGNAGIVCRYNVASEEISILNYRGDYNSMMISATGAEFTCMLDHIRIYGVHQLLDMYHAFIDPLIRCAQLIYEFDPHTV